MKKLLKSILAIVAGLTMAISFAGCSVDTSKYEGDWKLTQINNTSIEDKAAADGVDVSAYQGTIKVSKDSAVMGTGGNSETFKITPKKNGFELLDTDGKTIIMSFTYDDAAKTLSCDVDANGTKLTYKYEKGTYPVTEAPVATEAVVEGGESIDVESDDMFESLVSEGTVE